MPFFILAMITLALTVFSGWLTHIVICLQSGSWGFLIAGAILPPIGVIHGIGYWFGAW